MAKETKANIHEYRSLDDDGLDNKIDEVEMRLKKTKFTHAANPIENPLSIKLMRREIARLKTESRKRELGL